MLHNEHVDAVFFVLCSTTLHIVAHMYY